MLYNFFQFLKNPLKYIRNKKRINNRLEELRKRDPFIYK
jgi:hypothetical protein